MGKNIDHECWTFQIGDLVKTVKRVQAIPNRIDDPNITMHEGNMPWVESGVVGMITGMLGDEKDRWPLVFLLIGEEIFGIAGIHLTIAQRSQVVANIPKSSSL